MTPVFTPAPICVEEVLRYAGCKTPDPATLELLSTCRDEVEAVLTNRVCYKILPLRMEGDTCNFGLFNLTSKDLAAALSGCSRAVVFAATLGVGLDRLILKYSRLSPSRAVLIQALGAERIEALCDAVCKTLTEEEGGYATSRFSPGYGDLPLSSQRAIFAALQCEKRIGLCLNDSLLMSPTKSVTAIFGLSETPKNNPSKCSLCNKTDCEMRGA